MGPSVGAHHVQLLRGVPAHLPPRPPPAPAPSAVCADADEDNEEDEEDEACDDAGDDDLTLLSDPPAQVYILTPGAHEASLTPA